LLAFLTGPNCSELALLPAKATVDGLPAAWVRAICLALRLFFLQQIVGFRWMNWLHRHSCRQQ
jgi:hypothetical protein